MKKILFVMAAILLFSGVAMSEALYWHTSPATAFNEAAATGKKVFVDVFTQWCSWCKKLDQETFQDPTFIETAQKFVLLKVDADLQPDFKTKYQIKGYPSILFLNAKGEEVYQRVLGYMPASSLVPIMKKALGATQREDIVWYTDITQAFKTAQESGRLLFVDVYTEWCSWCKKLDQETFHDPKFLEIAPKFVLLKVDAEKQVEFANKYKVRAYPTMLFLTGTGEEVKRIKGFLTADELVPIMKEILGTSPSRELYWFTDIPKAFEAALAQNKIVFVDVFTEWCSWCKKLDKETFQDPKFNEIAPKFVLLKVDAEKEVEFAKKYIVRAYPTMLFLKGNGQEIHRIKGFLTADQLVPVMKKILEENSGYSLAK